MIPKILHFCLPEHPSAEQLAAVEAARRVSLGWEVMICQDPIDPVGYTLAPLWLKANSGAQLADLVRLEAVYRYGGVYLDSDVFLERPLDALCAHSRCFAASEDGESLTNAVFGAVPGHAAVGDLINILQTHPPDPTLPPDITTGPKFFARHWQWRRDVDILPRETFYPYNWDEHPRPPHPGTYGTHRWSGSWVKQRHFPRAQISKLAAYARKARRVAKDVVKSALLVVRLPFIKINGWVCGDEIVRYCIHKFFILLKGRDLSVTPEIYRNGYYELTEEIFCNRVLRGGDLVVDIGANAGIYSLLAGRRVGPFGRVIAYEPNPSMADMLERSVAMNWMHDRITVRREALGAREDAVTLEVADMRIGDARITVGHERDRMPESRIGDIGTKQVHQVKMVRLDAEFPHAVAIRLLKIDVEGLEADVLRGGIRLFEERSVDFAIVEAINERSSDDWESLLKMITSIVDFGYELRRFRRWGNTTSMNIQQMTELGPRVGRNILLSRRGCATGPLYRLAQ